MNEFEKDFRTHYCEHCGKFFKTEEDRLFHIKIIHAGKQQMLI